MSDLHRLQATYIPVHRGSRYAPPQRIPQRGQERCWRGIGDRNPLSLFNRPREEQIKSTRMTWYSPLVKPIQTTTAKRSFLIGRLQVEKKNQGRGAESRIEQNPWQNSALHSIAALQRISRNPHRPIKTGYAEYRIYPAHPLSNGWRTPSTMGSELSGEPRGPPVSITFQ